MRMGTCSSSTDFQSLPHLQLILVWEVFHQPRYFQTLPLAFLEQLESNNLQPILDSIRNLSRMGPWDLGDGVRLADDKKVFNFPKVVFRFSFDGTPIKGC